ncbi:uncharacterized protein TNIN_315701 [Trichonephila inaurata madagascariensis]|uniref:Uncharacterized protein n=1 Tax=Trichonephila inaurata madagascariensis TaxID=2747483 RepID=A0A8X6YTJ5_9ARAC|nr:uncharacterized protein TNIN_315701 [Trichonephila inaurata madagascariensis]
MSSMKKNKHETLFRILIFLEPLRIFKSPFNSPLSYESIYMTTMGGYFATEKLASSTQEIESQVRDLTSEILTAHDIASKPATHSELPFVQGELKHLFKERNRARKLWQFTRHPQHKTELNRLQNAIKRKVGLYRQKVWEDHLTSLDAEDGSLWGTAKAFRKKATPISALNGPNGTALSDTNKTDVIGNSLESQFKLNDIQTQRRNHHKYC